MSWSCPTMWPSWSRELCEGARLFLETLEEESLSSAISPASLTV